MAERPMLVDRAPARSADERVERALHALLAEAARPSGESELLRRRARFLLTRLATMGAEAEYPEAAALRRWLGAEVAAPRLAALPSRAPAPLAGTHPGPDRAGGRRSAGAALWLVGLVLAALLALPLGAVVLSYRTYVVLTASMAPTMPPGTLLVVEPVAAAAVVAGDVITVPHPERPSETVTHRVVRVEDEPTGRFLRTRGDANPVEDAWRVPATGPVWRVVASVPHAGRLYQAASDPSARLGLLVLPSLLLGGTTLVNLWRGDRRAPPPA